MDKVKSIFICVFLALLCVLTSQCIFLMWAFRDDYTSVSKQMLVITTQAQIATTQWAGYSKQLNDLLASPKTQESIGLFLRSGDDLNRSIKRFNVTLDLLNTAIKNTDKNVNENFIPAATSTLNRVESAVDQVLIQEGTSTARALTTTIRVTNDQLQIIGKSFDKTLNNLNISVLEFNKIVGDPNIKKSIENTVKTTEATLQTINNIEKKTEMLLTPPRLLYRVLKETAIIVGRIFIP
jgi:hypothetical protein